MSEKISNPDLLEQIESSYEYHFVDDEDRILEIVFRQLFEHLEKQLKS